MEELGALGGYLTNIGSEPELELRSQNSEVSDSACRAPLISALLVTSFAQISVS